ncbi:hypothetical protein SmJEL517_g00437 [Synchytrium microbalum]|uniref:Alpha/beta hydrolase fold-3 domain-containing protein n=1 Tax=Synchytrium microbalum TaxID=1806994 RepID=A0A507CEP5_9FUNG|nr:uncharacterized protein SmJEL517_g00437 [Synchytrium microbalum]TPX37659.1 hypothetical protein SmJEL517_g00437 [Synchytrium microbalum]
MTVTQSPQWPASWDETTKGTLQAFQQFLSIPDAITMRNVLSSLPAAPLPDDVVITQVTIPRIATKLEAKVDGDVAAEWQESTTLTDATKSSAPVCIYFHGGGYIVGSKEGGRPNTTILAQNGVRVLSINYRLGPEVLHPAAITDAYSTYKWVLSQGVKAEKVVVSGDSAGAGLTYALALYLRDQKEEMPAGLAPTTPFVELSLNSPSVNLGDEFTACMLVHTENAYTLKVMRDGYIKDTDIVKTDPYISPLLATPGGLPPQYITTGTCDRLLAEDLALTLTRFKSETIIFELYDDMIHDFQLLTFLPSAQKALVRQATFMKDVTTAGKKLSGSLTHFGPDGEKKGDLSEADLKSRLKDLVKRWKAVEPKAEGLAIYEKASA